MQDTHQDIYGHKVIFLYPSRVFQQEIIERLHTLEYEVYICQDYKTVKNILIRNPGSLLFINIDTCFDPFSWIYFINTLEDSIQFSSTRIGLISERMDGATQRLFEAKTAHTGGILKLEEDTEENIKTIVRTLDSMNAKGRRQYVRATCTDEDKAGVFWITKNVMFKLKVIDISAAGIAVKIPLRQAGTLKPGQQLAKITLTLKQKTIPINAVVYMVKPGQSWNTGVLMIDKTTSPSSMISIREYVAETLNSKLEADIFTMEADHTNYNITEHKFKKLQEERKKGPSQEKPQAPLESDEQEAQQENSTE